MRKVPVPKTVLDQVKSYVEHPGSEAPNTSVFDFPAQITSPTVAPPERPTIKVSTVRYLNSLPPISNDRYAGFPRGTALHKIAVYYTTRDPDTGRELASGHTQFIVYQDGEGSWNFFESKE